MRGMNKHIRTLNILVTALLMLALSRTPWVERYLEAVKSGESRTFLLSTGEIRGDAETEPVALPVMAALSERSGWVESEPTLTAGSELKQQLEEEAAKTRLAPIDARIDPVWKAIPGLNGREIDVAKTLRLASQLPDGTPVRYVYRDLPPKIGLDGLGAQPIYRGNPEKKMISLMINVAWGDEYLASMLETLAKENVRATFFLDGMWLKEHQEEAKAIAAAGHELSNHAYSHKNMSKLGDGQAREEIAKTEKLLQGIGVQNRLFAPPSGDFDMDTVRIAHSMQLRTILWTIDTVDWTKPAPETVIRKVASKLEPGAMILMHPTSASMQALPSIIQDAKRKGYALGTVSELISPERLPELETQLGK